MTVDNEDRTMDRTEAGVLVAVSDGDSGAYSELARVDETVGLKAGSTVVMTDTVQAELWDDLLAECWVCNAVAETVFLLADEWACEWVEKSVEFWAVGKDDCGAVKKVHYLVALKAE